MERVLSSVARLRGYLAGRGFVVGLVALALGRMLIVALFQYGAPFLPTHGGWYFHSGGDDEQYLDLAYALLRGRPVWAYVGIGGPLLMLPWVALTQPPRYEYYNFLMFVVLQNGFLLGALSVLLIGWLTRQLTGRPGTALLAAGIWALFPYLIFLGFYAHPQAIDLQDTYVPLVAWLNGLSDGPALFALLLGLVVFLESNARQKARLAAWSGLLLGFGLAIRIQILPGVAVLWALVALRREFRILAGLTVGIVLGYLPQLIYNTALAGSPFINPYTRNFFGISSQGIYFNLYNTPFAPKVMLDGLTGMATKRPALVGLLMLGAVACLPALRRLARENGWFAAGLLVGVPGAIFGMHFAAYMFFQDPFRFSSPTFPFVSVWAAVVMVDMLDRLERLWARRSAVGRRGQRAPVGVAPAVRMPEAE